MKKFVLIVVAVVLVAVIGGGVFLATWTIPAPADKIERPVADDRMPK